MNLLYISLAEVLVFSDASVFSENQPNCATGRGWSEYVLYWWSAYELMAEGINWMFLKWNRDRTIEPFGIFDTERLFCILKWRKSLFSLAFLILFVIFVALI